MLMGKKGFPEMDQQIARMTRRAPLQSDFTPADVAVIPTAGENFYKR